MWHYCQVTGSSLERLLFLLQDRPPGPEQSRTPITQGRPPPPRTGPQLGTVTADGILVIWGWTVSPCLELSVRMTGISYLPAWAWFESSSRVGAKLSTTAAHRPGKPRISGVVGKARAGRTGVQREE